MKSTLTTVGLLLTVALTATISFAGQQDRPSRTIAEGDSGSVASSTTSGLTREAVRAEYFAARNSGTLPVTSEGDSGVAGSGATSSLTRDEVIADYCSARNNGTLPRTGEVS